MRFLRTIAISASCALLGAGVVAWATQTNYIGTVFLADTTTPTNQLKVNADGSIITSASPTGGYGYSNITTATTTQVKSGAGTLHTLTFNKPTATAVVTLYDNTTGTTPTIGTITVPTSPQPVTLYYDLQFNNGLTIVTATAASDLTVSFK